MIGLVWILDEGRDFELSRRSFRELLALYLDSLGRQLTLSDFDLDGVLACFLVSICFLFCFSCGFERRLISSSCFFCTVLLIPIPDRKTADSLGF